MDRDNGGGMPWWLAPWMKAMPAPQQLSQPILPGWSLFSITNQNSSKPDTERAIVAEQSYGRQIGVLMAALRELIGPLDEGSPAAFRKLDELHARIEQIKCDAGERRLAMLGEDLAALKERLPAEEYEQRIAALRDLLNG